MHKESHLSSKRSASLSARRNKKQSAKKGGAVRASSSVARHSGKYASVLNQLSARARAAQKGGSSDWVNTLYSAGPINSPPQSEAEFRAFNSVDPYPEIGGQTLTSPDIDAVMCGKSADVVGYSPDDSFYGLAGGSKRTKRSATKRSATKRSATKRSAKTVKRSAKTVKRSATKRSVKRSATKRSVKRGGVKKSSKMCKVAHPHKHCEGAKKGGAKKRSTKKTVKRSTKKACRKSCY